MYHKLLYLIFSAVIITARPAMAQTTSDTAGIRTLIVFFDGVTGLAIRDKITSPGQRARASFASEMMAIEDAPVSMEAPSVTGGA